MKSYRKRLEKLIRKLTRSENGCPWNSIQTHESLIPFILEESNEVIYAILNKDNKNLKEELGDVLLQVFLHSAIAQKKNKFCIKDVEKHLYKKIRRRHPHIFKKKNIISLENVKKQWQLTKNKEYKNQKTDINFLYKQLQTKHPLDGLHYICQQSKFYKLGWESHEQIWDKFFEEIRELKNAEIRNNKGNIEEELGDLFLCLVSLCESHDLHPLTTIVKTNTKFVSRLKFIDKKITFNDENTSRSMIKKIWEQSKSKNE